MENIKKKQEKARNVSGAEKRKRRKAFTRIKDTLHRGLGNKVFSGIGEGKKSSCDNCGKHESKFTSMVVKGIIVMLCEYCKNKVDWNEVADKKLNNKL